MLRIQTTPGVRTLGIFFRALPGILFFAIANAASLLAPPVRLHAQETLRVLRHSPTDTAASGSIVTVTFSRPVAGMLDRTIAADKVMTISPAVPGHYEWRDPITLRFTPSEALVPGTQHVVKIDTAAIASVGGRTAQPFEFTIQVPAARRLRTSVDDEEVFGSDFRIAPYPTFRLMYSGAVDIDSVAKLSRLQFSNPRCGSNIPLRIVSERAFRNGDPLSYRDEWNRDSLARQFWRVIEMVPADTLKPSCAGQWVVPLFNEKGAQPTVMHAVNTYPEFRIDSISGCVRGIKPCDPIGLTTWFSAPVLSEQIASKIQVSPGLIRNAASGRVMSVGFAGRLTAKARYTVSVDTSVRDAFGRRLVGPSSISVTARNRQPALRHQSQLVTLTSASPTLIVRAVNVDTLTAHVRAIPDSLRFKVLSSSRESMENAVDAIARSLPQIAQIDVAVRGTFNNETDVAVRLPPHLAALARQGILAIRFSIKVPSVDPDSVELTAARRAETERLAALSSTKKRSTDEILEPSYGLLVQISDLQSHSKVAGKAGVALVTDTHGKPVSGADVAIFDEAEHRYAHATTNQDGLSRLVPAPREVIAKWPKTPAEMRGYGTRFLEIRHGPDRLIAPLDAPQSNSLNGEFGSAALGAGVPAGDQTHGTLYTDRGVYRPGDMVLVKAYIRHGVPEAMSAKAADSIELRFDNPDGDLFHEDDEHRFALNAFGSVVDSIRLPLNARTGTYTVHAFARVNGEWNRVGRYVDFRVAEFKAPEFLVKLEPVSIGRKLSDALNVDIAATYLFGGPMAGAHLKWSAVSDNNPPSVPQIPNTKGFVFGESRWWAPDSPPYYVDLGATDSLDRQGKLRLSVPIAEARLHGSSQIEISVAVTDVNNQTITSTTNVSLRSSSLFVGVKDRSESWYWRTGQQQTIHAIAVRASGMRLATVPLTVTIRRWSWLNDPTSYRSQRWVADTVKQLHITSSVDGTSVMFTPEVDGAYDVQVTAVDDLGLPAIANFGRWAYATPWFLSAGTNPLRLRMSTDHDHGRRYSFGDTARISFDSPFDRATAWMAIEREGVIEQHALTVSRGTTTWKIPVTKRLAPNVWASIVLVAQQDSNIAAINAVHEQIRAGYAELRVDSTAHALRVVVTPVNPTLAPGDVARIKVAVNEMRSGRAVRSEVALWAVDEGVLSMTEYKTPDILTALDARLGVSSYLYSSVAQSPWRQVQGELQAGVSYNVAFDPFNVMMLRGNVAAASIPASSPDLVSPLLRSKFRFTAFFVGSAITDSNGVVTIERKLPDNITTFRLMATAVTKGERYGSGQSSLLVTRQVVIRPSLPRFVRFGDSLSVDATLNVRSGSPAKLTVNARVSDRMLIADSVQRVSLTGRAAERARFQMVVPERSSAESVTVHFDAVEHATGKRDAIRSAIPLRPTGTPRAHTAIGMVRDSGIITVNLPAGIDATRSTYSLSLGTSPLVAMRANFARLRRYENQSTELLITTARSLLSLSRAERTMGEVIVTRDSASVQADLQAAVDELTKREVDDGYFANWPGSKRSESVWFSAYIGMFLLDAREEGIKVPEQLLDNVTDRLASAFKNPQWMTDSLRVEPENRRYWLLCKTGDRLVSLEFLRKAGQPLPASEDSLLADAKNLFWEDRVALTEMLAERADLQPGLRELLEAAWRGVTVAGKRIDMPDSARNNDWFPSHVRPAARLLTATLKLNPQHALIGALSETIIQQGSVEQGWAWNSMDYGSAVEALGAFVATQRGNPGGRFVARDARGRILFSQNTAAASSVAMTSRDSLRPLQGVLRGTANDSSALSVSIRLENADGSVMPRNAPLYYSVTVNEIPLKRPVTPDAAGITVERWYERFSDGKPIVEVKEGDLIRVRVRVTVPSDRQYVAVEDLLPAGLEIVDLSMRTSSTVGPFAAANAARNAALGRDFEEDDDEADFNGLATGGTWESGWWSPWEYKEARDDRAFYFARQLWSGTYGITYLARATTAGTFIAPPAHAEEMYNRALQGRSSGGTIIVRR